jgi:hypothetical protein
MSKGVSVIHTALTTKIRPELSYREHSPEPAARVFNGDRDESIGDYDFVALSDSGDSLKLPALGTF